MTKREFLCAQKTKKFEEICALIARELGYGQLSKLNDAERKRVKGEAEYRVKEWEETVEMRTRPTLRPVTPLRRLLTEYLDICDRLLDQHDIEIGIWTYKKGLRRLVPLRQ